MKRKLILIGDGVMGKKHFERFNEMGCEFLARLDSSEEVERFFENTSEFPSGVIIASPSSTHAHYVKKCLEWGLDVFVEKPLSTSLSSSLELIELSKEKGKVLFVAHSERFRPDFQELLSKMTGKISEGDFSFVRHNLVSNRGRDVSVAFDLLVHDLDLFFALCSPRKNYRIENVFFSSSDSLTCELLCGNIRARFEVSRNATVKRRVFKWGTLGTFDFSSAGGRPDALDIEHETFLQMKAGEGGDLLKSASFAVEIAEKIEKMRENFR